MTHLRLKWSLTATNTGCFLWPIRPRRSGSLDSPSSTAMPSFPQHNARPWSMWSGAGWSQRIDLSKADCRQQNRQVKPGKRHSLHWYSRQLEDPSRSPWGGQVPGSKSHSPRAKRFTWAWRDRCIMARIQKTQTQSNGKDERKGAGLIYESWNIRLVVMWGAPALWRRQVGQHKMYSEQWQSCD